MRHALALAVAALLPAAASAEISLATDGSGQAVYLPYYTVDDGLASLLTLANTSDQPKAVRITFVESLNGQRVLGFNVYLSPFDSWTAALADGGDPSAPARLFTADGSCTVPAIPDAGQPFFNFNYANNFPDGGPTGLERTRSGSIEVIEMGVPDVDVAGAIAERECSVITQRFLDDGAWASDPNDGLAAPGGGLTASLMLVDAGNGIAWQLPGTAIEGFALRPHQTLPEMEMPRITDPVAAADDEDFLVRRGDGSLLRIADDRGPDAVSALFMSSALRGEFVTSQDMGASTDWLIAFPTRHAYVADLPGSLLGTDGSAAAPFTEAFDADGACESAFGRRWDREGDSIDDVLSPPLPPVELCAQAQLVAFGDDVPASGFITAGTPDGRARLDLAHQHALTVADGDGPLVLEGLPVLGYRLSGFVNANASPGVLANYSVGEPLEATPAETASE